MATKLPTKLRSKCRCRLHKKALFVLICSKSVSKHEFRALLNSNSHRGPSSTAPTTEGNGKSHRRMGTWMESRDCNTFPHRALNRRCTTASHSAHRNQRCSRQHAETHHVTCSFRETRHVAWDGLCVGAVASVPAEAAQEEGIKAKFSYC